MSLAPSLFFFFFFNDTATTEIYTLSLHDALPILQRRCTRGGSPVISVEQPPCGIAFQRLIYQAPGAGHNIALAWTSQSLRHHFNDTFPLGLLVDSRVVDVLAPGSASPVFMHGPCHFSHGPLSMWAVARHTPPAPGTAGDGGPACRGRR